MTRRTMAWLTTLGGAAILVLAACSSSSATAGATSGNGSSGSPSAAAPSVAAPSVAVVPSAAASEELPGSSVAIPSFVLPNDDKGLEALLPDELCGGKATKLSFGGSRFADVADENFKSMLAALGKSASDVSFAVAAPALASSSACSTSAGVFRVKGADLSRLKDVFLAEAAKEGPPPTQGNVGGKAVYISAATGADTKTYSYFNGDALFFVTAKDDTAAAAALQDMP